MHRAIQKQAYAFQSAMTSLRKLLTTSRWHMLDIPPFAALFGRKCLRCGVAAGLAIAAVACRPQSSEGPKESGNRQPADAEWSDAAAWHVGEEPSMDLTSDGSGPAYEFYHVVGLCWSNRYVVVADGGSGTIRLFAWNGTHVRTFGGSGRGPGEFSLLRAVFCTSPDTIKAFDIAADRVSVFSAETGVLRTTRLALLHGHPPEGVFPLTDGGWVGTINSPTEGAARVSGETHRNAAIHVLYSDSGVVRAVIATAPGQEFVSQGGGLYTIPLYAFQAVQTVHDDTLYALTADSFEISVISLDGNVQRTITRSGLDLSVSREEAAAKVQEVFRRRTGTRTGGAVMSSEYPFPLPQTKPPMSRILVDSLNNVWVGDFAELDEHPHEWSVFGPRGDFLGSVRPPEHFHLMAVGANRVGGVLRDSLDVEHVVLLPLIKPGKRTR